MGVGEDPVGEDGMDIDAPAWPPAGVEAANEGVIREGDPGDFYMKVIAKKFRDRLWSYGGCPSQEQPPVDADGEARLVTVPEGDDQSSESEEEGWEGGGGGGAAGAGWTSDEEEEEEEAHLRAWESAAVPGSETNALTFAVMKCSAQVKSKNSNNSAVSEWQLLHDIMPAGFTWGGMAVPRSHKAMRKFLRVPDTSSRYVRHMCPKGCVAFSGAPGKAAEWANLPDQHCPECNADRFIRTPQSLKLTAARVRYVLSVADIIKGWFRDPVWYACSKKGTDVSINAFRASSEAERLNEGGHGTGLAAGDFLHADNGIYTLTDDGFLSHLRATQSVSGVAIRCEDMPPHMLTSRSNWHPVALIGPPEPPNMGKILLEVLHELAVLGEHGVRVTPADGGEQFVHKVFLGIHVECPDGTVKVAPAGYAKDVIQRVDGVELQAVRTGASCLLLSGDQMLEQMGVIGQIEEDLAKSDLDGDEDGELSPAARRAFNTTRLEQAKQNIGCHCVCQEDRRKALVLIPSNFGRGLRPSFAVSKKSKGSGKVTVQSGWVIEDCWHHTESFSLLTAGPLFEEARVKAIMTGKELASPAVMRAVSQLGVLGHMYKRMQGAVWFVTRWGLQNVVTEEDGPERKAQVDALTREGRTRYLADITVYARLAEGNGFVSLLVSNLHSAVCRMIHQMMACGHPFAELWMENLMGFLKAGAKRVLPKNVCETMMRDLLFAQQINRMKAHRLYREPNPNKKGYMAPDDAGPGAVETPIRLVGSASAAWEHAVDFKDHLEKLLDDVRRTELESEEELPRNLLAEREDAKYTTMVARAQHFYLATPPPPPGADSDDSRASARPIRAALCTVWTPERAHTAVGLDLWRVPGGGGGSGGEEALVLLDGPGICKVAVLLAPADMSSAKAADLGVDAGELLMAGIHARSQDGVAAAVGNGPPAPVSDDGGSKVDDVMGVGEDPVGEDGMDIDAPAWPPAGVEPAMRA
eukprot:jgi/Tetstr1/423119/TSEL_013889.t1